MVDLFFYRDPEEAEKEEQAAIEAKQPKEEYAPQQENWNPDAPAAPAPEVADWAAEAVPVSAVPIQPGYGTAPAPAAAEDWSATDTGDWAAGSAAAAGAATAPAAAPAAAAGNEWGGGAAENWG